MPSTNYRLHPVALELLRHGEPHNQLLSRITDYVALCGSLGAETVRLPFNHLEHELRLEGLSYMDNGLSNAARLDEMADQMAQLLSKVPGLAPALSQCGDQPEDMALLRLVLTPHELALLPFECTNVPKGAPGGAGSRLLLQTKAAVTMTREVRGITPPSGRWPARPRVLFAWAAPNGVEAVPWEQHLDALREAMDPWLEPYRGSGGEKEHLQHMARQFARHITVLPQASAASLLQACSQAPYTHVHLLAHGARRPQARGHTEVGLALHGSTPGTQDVVDGRRLANALRFGGSPQGDLPAVVVLATCDSGRVGSVVTHGASMAHTLHIAGVSLVVASQFPLSMPGSVVMTQEFYRRIFAAEDPRVAMHFVRCRLSSTFPDFHDWASLVVYASLPRDFDTQLAAHQHAFAKRRSNRLLDDADALIDSTLEKRRTSSHSRAAVSPTVTPQQVHERLLAIERDLEDTARALLERTDDKIEGTGLQASTKKRMAEVLYWASREGSADSSRPELRRRSLDALMQACELYRQAMARSLSTHWVGVQYLCLSLVLNKAGRLSQSYDPRLWGAVCMAAELQFESGDTQQTAWAHAGRAELAMLEITRQGKPPSESQRREVFDYIRLLVEIPSLDPFVIYSTRRQFGRYVDWWSLPLAPHEGDAGQGLNTFGIASDVFSMLSR